MNVQLQGNEQITKLFNDWYLAMLKQDVSQATNLKHEIEEKELNFEEDENLALYYSLLDFRFKVLTDGLSITKDSFNKIDSTRFHLITNFLTTIIYLKRFMLL